MNLEITFSWTRVSAQIDVVSLWNKCRLLIFTKVPIASKQVKVSFVFLLKSVSSKGRAGDALGPL